MNVLYTVDAVHVHEQAQLPRFCATTVTVNRLINRDLGGLENQPSIQADNRTDAIVHW